MSITRGSHYIYKTSQVVEVTDSEARRHAGDAPREARTRSTEESRGNRGAKGREVSYTPKER